MNYTRKSFSVPMGQARISDENWERTFGKKTAPAIAPKETVPVSGVWVRTREFERDKAADRGGFPMAAANHNRKWTLWEILVEVDGEWRVVQEHETPSIDSTISHITEPAGIQKAPKDYL